MWQLMLALTQQIVLVPLFLRYWSSDTLSAWLTIFAAGNLVLAADAGLHIWSLNRFLALKSRNDCDRRTRRFYGAISQLFIWLALALALLILLICAFVAPSKALGFTAESHFDIAFIVMVLGFVFCLIGNLPSALYRAHGLYGRIGRIQAWATVIGQVAQLISLAATASLLAVVIAYVAPLVGMTIFICLIDVHRRFPFLDSRRSRISWRWTIAQFHGAFPFSVMNFVETGLAYLSILLIGVFVSDRIAIAQWGLTRTIANLLRGLCYQLSLPLAAELGHDHAVGNKDSLQRLYARGSFTLVLFISGITSGLIAFWPDFFVIWTQGTIPYDMLLSNTLLIGTCITAPAILALSYANYSNRGRLLLGVKSAQLVMFLTLSIALIPRLGTLGAAIALISSDLVTQAGYLSFVILRGTLRHPLRYILFVLATMTAIILAGMELGETIRHFAPGVGVAHFVLECTVWLVLAGLLASPLALRTIRERLLASIPH
jgi:O-antigen/teichoic acid export membrane protein